ncbi:MAG: hypothetical protein WC569_02550, partial [Candidatus Omnitrophota bacterium]
MTARLTGRKIIPAVFLLTLSLCGCDKPSYPAGKVEDSLIKLCEDEYGLTDVKVKITGSTLGVYIPIEGLVDSNLKLDKDAGEKIEDVALSIHRVTTSTDMPLKFYTLTARDTRAIGAEFILTGFIYDVIRVRLLDISRGEYFRRILRDFRFNPAIMGEQKIKEFFDALKKDPALAERVKFLFYPIYAIGKKDTQDIRINEMDAKEVSEREALLYVRTIESYEVAPGFEAYLAIFPPGFNNEYLVLIDLSA